MRRQEGAFASEGVNPERIEPRPTALPSTEKMRTLIETKARGTIARPMDAEVRFREYTRVEFRLPRTEADDENVVARIYDAMLDHLDEYGENQADVLDAATPGQRAIYALLAADGEVNNAASRSSSPTPPVR